MYISALRTVAFGPSHMGTPIPPLRHADVLNGWPLIINIILLIGGKGRTGTMICVWLVEAGVFSTATQSLDYFGNRRTDTNVSKKFQGVSDCILLLKLF